MYICAVTVLLFIAASWAVLYAVQVNYNSSLLQCDVSCPYDLQALQLYTAVH
jgi:hypothetical protein